MKEKETILLFLFKGSIATTKIHTRIKGQVERSGKWGVSGVKKGEGKGEGIDERASTRHRATSADTSVAHLKK